MVTISKDVDVDVCTVCEVDIELEDVYEFIDYAGEVELKRIAEAVHKGMNRYNPDGTYNEVYQYLIDDYWDEFISEIKQMYTLEEVQKLVPLKW